MLRHGRRRATSRKQKPTPPPAPMHRSGRKVGLKRCVSRARGRRRREALPGRHAVRRSVEEVNETKRGFGARSEDASLPATLRLPWEPFPFYDSLPRQPSNLDGPGCEKEPLACVTQSCNSQPDGRIPLPGYCVKRDLYLDKASAAVRALGSLWDRDSQNTRHAPPPPLEP